MIVNVKGLKKILFASPLVGFLSSSNMHILFCYRSPTICIFHVITAHTDQLHGYFFWHTFIAHNSSSKTQPPPPENGNFTYPNTYTALVQKQNCNHRLFLAQQLGLAHTASSWIWIHTRGTVSFPGNLLSGTGIAAVTSREGSAIL